MADNPTGGGEQPTNLARNALALTVTSLAFVGILTLAVTAIVVAPADKRDQAVQLVLTGVLPLFGSWVGTILAFFFSSESLRTATNSVAALTQQLTGTDRLRSTPVRDAMIRRADLKGVETRPFDQVKIADALKKLDDEKINRLLVFADGSDQPLLVVHRSFFDRFLAAKVLAVPPVADPGQRSLKEMLDDPNFKTLLASTFETVGEGATLADAKERMARTPNCQDVFVTRSGARTDPVLGWVTNVTIEEKSKV
jgi:hypothetical protein